MGFNTTFVTVLSQATKANNAIDKRFNTTFVTVLYHIEAVYLHEKERFNTTFVTVLSAFLLVSYFIISQDIP